MGKGRKREMDLVAAEGGAAPTKGLRYLRVVVFFSGMSVMGVEMAASRLLAPWFGTSLFVWTNIIGLIMVSLSAGYWVGGRLADRRPDPRTFYGLLFGAGLLVALIPIAAHPVMAASSKGLSLVLGSLLVVALLFGIPIFLLGMISPFAIRLSASTVEATGQTAGSIYALSTLGSILGTWLPAFVMIPFMGTHRSILAFGGILAFLGAVGMGRKRWVAAALIPFTLMGTGWTARAGVRGKVVLETESSYNYIRVVERPVGSGPKGPRQRRLLVLNEGRAVHSIYDPDGWSFPLVGSVWDVMAMAPLFLDKKEGEPLDVCIVGLAAGTVAKELIHFFGPQFDVHVDGVEIDGEIVRIGRERFAMNEKELDVHVMDGRIFLARNEKRYDLIVTDAYKQPYVPFHLTTEEYFGLVKSRLKPGGFMTINVGVVSTDTQLYKGITRTVRSVFPHTARIPIIFDKAPFQNHIILASASPLDPKRLDPKVNPLVGRMTKRSKNRYLPGVIRKMADGFTTVAENRVEVFTDDRAPVEVLTDFMIFDYVVSGGYEASGQS